MSFLQSCKAQRPRFRRLRMAKTGYIIHPLCQQGTFEKRGGSNSAATAGWAASINAKVPLWEQQSLCPDTSFHTPGRRMYQTQILLLPNNHPLKYSILASPLKTPHFHLPDAGKFGGRQMPQFSPTDNNGCGSCGWRWGGGRGNGSRRERRRFWGRSRCRRKSWRNSWPGLS